MIISLPVHKAGAEADLARVYALSVNRIASETELTIQAAVKNPIYDEFIHRTKK